MKTIDKINLQIQRVLDVSLGAISMVMLAMNLAQVLRRYVLYSSITWSEELSTYIYVWIIFLALCAACRRRSELEVRVLRLKGPRGGRTILMVRELLDLAAYTAFLYESVLMIRNSLAFPQKTASLKTITAHLCLCMPLSSTLLVWMEAMHIIHDIRLLSGRRTDEADTGKQGRRREMSTVAIVLIVSAIIFAVLGVSLVWSLVLTCVCSVAMRGTLDALPILVRGMFTGGLQYSLLAVFFFVLTGAVMQYGGLSERLVDFADSLVGRISGEASLVCIIACTFFATISGSAVATAATTGGIMYSKLKRLGYPENYTAALPATAGVLGIIILPSVLLILYGDVVSVSPGKLLMADVIPGLIGAFFIYTMCYVFAKRRSYPGNEGFEAKVVIRTLKNFIWTLLMSVIILGGIYTRIFAPTESDAAAAVYGLICATVIYQDMDLALSRRVTKKNCRTTVDVMILYMAATSFNCLLITYQIPATLNRFLIINVSSHYMFMIGATILLLFLGMLMGVAVSALILTPMLAPVAVAFGIDPIQFSLIPVFIMAIGQATPPFGTSLFVACGYSGRSVMSMGRHSLVFCSASMLVVLLCMIFPGISTLLPGVMTQ